MTGYRCKTCGRSHAEDPTSFLFELPLYALQVPEAERGRRIQASSDQCIVDGEHFFILGNLDVPVQGSEGFIRWTAWTTLSHAHFLRASELWQAAGRESEPPYCGLLSNEIPGYPSSLSIKSLVHTQPVGTRPRIEIIEESHPLFRDQRQGVSPERLQELIHVSLQQ